MNKVCVIIVNWNGKHFLKDCLPSLLRQTYSNYQIWVVDNGSTDDSVSYVRQSFPSVNLITLDKNMGFAYTNNLAMREALKDEQIKYIALLNNDTVADPGWLEELVKEMEKNDKIGICASKMLKMDNPDIIDSTGHVFNKWGFLIDRGIGEIDKGQYDTAKDVIGACAGACLYRREMLEKIGFFDESFRTNYEDAELSWRAYRKGWKARFIPTSLVYHKRGGTMRKNNLLYYEMSCLGLHNKITTLKRHGSFIHKLLYSFYLIRNIEASIKNSCFNRKATTPFGIKSFGNALIELWTHPYKLPPYTL